MSEASSLRFFKKLAFWGTLVEALKTVGIENIAAAGAEDASDTSLEGLLPCAWMFSRPLDCSLAWFSKARLIISTDNGLAHLAVWCGKHLLLLPYADGRIAPGPVVDEHGRVFRWEYWRINMEQFSSENHMHSTIEVITDSWGNPEAVALRAATNPKAATALLCVRYDRRLSCLTSIRYVTPDPPTDLK